MVDKTNVGSVVGITLGTKLANGKFKPKFGASAIIVIIAMLLLLVASLIGFIYGLMSNEITTTFEQL